MVRTRQHIQIYNVLYGVCRENCKRLIIKIYSKEVLTLAPEVRHTPRQAIIHVNVNDKL